MIIDIINSDALDALKAMKSENVDCFVTSPPYYNQRDYGVEGQIGKEETPEEYIRKLVTIFCEAKRVLKKDGTLWINISDSYNGSGKGRNSNGILNDSTLRAKQGTNTGSIKGGMARTLSRTCKVKDLIGIPWMLAFALRDNGWYLRQDIIWHKPNPMPESVKDRCTKSHEYIFLLSKSKKYYFDAEAISEPVAESTTKRFAQSIKKRSGAGCTLRKTNGNMEAAAPRYGGKKYTENPEQFYRTKSGNAYVYRPRRNKRDVWTVTTKPYKGAHFATFPSDLIEPCVLAGCPEGGVVCDMFAGSGTVGKVAKKYSRNAILIEINKDYIPLIKERVKDAKEAI